MRRTTTTALVVGGAALAGAGAVIGASLTGDDPDPIAPIAITAQAATIPATARVAVVDGDADVFGDEVRLEAETTQAVGRVEFVYGGQRHAAELTETDAEDATKEWGATVPALAADRRPGETLQFRVEACDQECAAVQITELVEFDD